MRRFIASSNIKLIKQIDANTQHILRRDEVTSKRHAEWVRGVTEESEVGGRRARGRSEMRSKIKLNQKITEIRTAQIHQNLKKGTPFCPQFT